MFQQKTGTLGTAPLYLRDGDILFFKDNREQLKELTKEEKKKFEKEAMMKRNSSNSYYYPKEEALFINVKD